MRNIFMLLFLVTCCCPKKQTEIPKDIENEIKNISNLKIEVAHCYSGIDLDGPFSIKVLKSYTPKGFLVDIVQKTKKVVHMQEFVYTNLSVLDHRLEALDCEAFEDIKRIELEFIKKTKEELEENT